MEIFYFFPKLPQKHRPFYTSKSINPISSHRLPSLLCVWVISHIKYARRSSFASRQCWNRWLFPLQQWKDEDKYDVLKNYISTEILNCFLFSPPTPPVTMHLSIVSRSFVALFNKNSSFQFHFTSCCTSQLHHAT
jgi:hypothetical protein